MNHKVRGIKTKKPDVIKSWKTSVPKTRLSSREVGAGHAGDASEARDSGLQGYESGQKLPGCARDPHRTGPRYLRVDHYDLRRRPQAILVLEV